MKKVLLYIVVALLISFGLLTIFLSTSIIFDLYDVRAKEGNYVLFVVWSNFMCGFLYLFSIYGFLTAKIWTYKVLGVSAMILTFTFIAFLFYIQSGGIYEDKTVGALLFRIALTLGFTLFAYFTINKKRNK